MEILSWRYYDTSIHFSKILSIQLFQFAVALVYNLLLVQVFLFIQRKTQHKIRQYVLYALTIFVFAMLTVLVNSTWYKYMLNHSELFLKLPVIGINSLQKIIYLSCFTTLFFLLRNYKELQFQKKQTLEAKNTATQSQLQMLQQQLNPHFLFNTLNSLRSLINVDPEKAREMVTDISDFLRVMVQSNQLAELSVADEVKIVQNYLRIQKMRFNGNLLVDYQVQQESLEDKIPAFILQPLAENAIKHGMFGDEVLKININVEKHQDDLLVSVVNNGKIKTSNGEQSSGNKNITQRLELLYGNNASFKLHENEGMVYSDVRIKMN